MNYTRYPMRILLAALLPLGLLPAHAAISVVRVASGLEQPVYVTAPPGDTTRLFIVEANSGGHPTSGPKIARIKILNLSGRNQGTINATPFLTLTGIPQVEDQGLFNLVFHPNYADNGFFYVTYAVGFDDVPQAFSCRIERYQVSAGDPDVADPASATTILEYAKPYYNHNTDWLGFSPNDAAAGKFYMYVTTGDGGSNTDPNQMAQNLGMRHGKLLRIDVGADGLADDFPLDPDENYAIPPDNPFQTTIGADDAIWARGLRNPWRASFDRLTGDLYIGNVGANQADEVEFQPADSAGGENYGWSCLEGTGAGPNCGGVAPPDDTLPMFEEIHGGDLTAGPKRSITGGYVYRGSVLELRGHYVFGDFLGNYNFGNQTGQAQLFSFRYDGSDPSTFNGDNIVDGQVINRTAEFAPDVGTIQFVSSFGEDAAGDLYIVDMGNLGTPNGQSQGEVFRITGTGSSLVTGLQFSSTGMVVSWDANPGASAYDSLRGDLGLLRSTGGDFSQAVISCLEDQSSNTQSSASQQPLSGDGWFYLARPVNAVAVGGSYDTAGPGQSANRDAAIHRSQLDCP